MRIWSVTLLVLLVAAVGAAAFAGEKSFSSVTWDDYYIYTVVSVDSTDINATHSQYNAPVEGDDSVTVHIDVTGKAGDKIGPGCFAMTVSAAGGCQFFVGGADGTYTAKPAFTYKYGVDIKGTLNSSDDKDLGYTVEIALPWQLLETKAPAPNTKMGYNILIRDGKTLHSLSPLVKGEADALSPDKWSRLEIVETVLPGYTPNRTNLIAAKFGSKPPLIDGKVSTAEWPERFAVSFSGAASAPAAAEPPAQTEDEQTPDTEPEQPEEPAEEATEPEVQPTQEATEPEATEPTQEVSTPEPQQAKPTASLQIPKLVFTTYYYWFQSDANRGIPVENTRSADGANHWLSAPLYGLGPWVSYDRPQWHLQQLQRISQAGIDVILPAYRGDKTSGAGYARRGLDAMVSALNTMLGSAKHIPTVGMLLDISSLRDVYADTPDLSNEDVRTALYGMIKNFYQRIPPQHRALVKTRRDSAAGLGYPVFIMNSGSAANLDTAALQYCSTLFAREFGQSLVWIGDNAPEGSDSAFDGISSPGTGPAFTFSKGEYINIARVGADYQSAQLAQDNPLRVTLPAEPDKYATAWGSAITAQPDWILCDSMDVYVQQASSVSSAQPDNTIFEVTKSQIAAFKPLKEFNAAYVSVDMPGQLQPGQFSTARITLRNSGSMAWKRQDDFAISYRWYKDGRYFANSGIKVPLRTEVEPSEQIILDFGIAPVDENKADVPAGDVAIRLELIRSSDNKWLSDLGGDALVLPVTIGVAPEFGMSMVRNALPVNAETAATYRVPVSFRNEGTKTWDVNNTRLVGKLYMDSSFSRDNPAASKAVDMKDISVPLPHNCSTGMIVDMLVELPLVGSDGKPLPSWQQSADWSYVFKWDMIVDGQSVSQATGREFSNAISMFDSAAKVTFGAVNVPEKIAAGKKAKVNAIVRNVSGKPLKKKDSELLLRWFNPDGTPLGGGEQSVGLKADVPAGGFTMLVADVVAPEKSGTYLLHFDFAVSGQRSSETRVNSGKEIDLRFVEVTD